MNYGNRPDVASTCPYLLVHRTVPSGIFSTSQGRDRWLDGDNSRAEPGWPFRGVNPQQVLFLDRVAEGLIGSQCLRRIVEGGLQVRGNHEGID